MAAASRAMHSQPQPVCRHGIQGRKGAHQVGERPGWAAPTCQLARAAECQRGVRQQGYCQAGHTAHACGARICDCSPLSQANPPLTSCRGGEETRAVERGWVAPRARDRITAVSVNRGNQHELVSSAASDCILRETMYIVTGWHNQASCPRAAGRGQGWQHGTGGRRGRWRAVQLHACSLVVSTARLYRPFAASRGARLIYRRAGQAWARARAGPPCTAEIPLLLP